MQHAYRIIEKKQGETPLQALERLRDHESLPDTLPLAYAGRLDPMASGKLLVLIGDECKRQKKYHALDKEYKFEILFGFETDTGDILGKAAQHKDPLPSPKSIKGALTTLGHVVALPYPAFSSRTIQGKPLFLWALEGRLAEIEIPTATTKLHKICFIKTYEITGHELLQKIEQRINDLPHVTEDSKKLGADFRREEILEIWKSLLLSQPEHTFTIAQCSAIVSSGTYIRSLAPYIAQMLGTHGLAFSIHRTTIGRYLPLTKRMGLWTKRYT